MEPEEDCGFIDPACVAGNALRDAVNDAIDNLAEKIVEAMGKAISSLATFWVNVDTPGLTDGGGNPSAPVAFVQGSLSYYVAAAAVVAVLIGGARMAYERRAEPGRDLLRAMMTLVLVSGASLAGIGLAVTAADGFAAWIIGRSTDDFGAGLNRMITLGSAAGPNGAGAVSAILLIVLGLGGLFASLVQIVLLVVRGGFLIVLAGVLPLSASFTNTETGRAWFQRALSWVVAFILYKPTAAIIYATAFQLIGTTGDDPVTSALTGVTLMIMSLVALPALLKFVAPMVGAATSGGGGGGGAALAASVASGAVSARMVKGGSSTGAGGGSGRSGPSGSTPAGGPTGTTGGPSPTGSGGTPPGGSGPSGGPGNSGPSGSGGGPGAAGPGGGPGAAGLGGSSAGAGTAGAGGGAGATGGAAAGGAAGGAVGAGVALAQRGVGAARGAADSASNDDGGPSGSR